MTNAPTPWQVDAKWPDLIRDADGGIVATGRGTYERENAARIVAAVNAEKWQPIETAAPRRLATAARSSFAGGTDKRNAIEPQWETLETEHTRPAFPIALSMGRWWRQRSRHDPVRSPQHPRRLLLVGHGARSARARILPRDQKLTCTN